MLSRTLSADHWRTAWAASVEGAALAGLGQYPVAETMLLTSLKTLENGPGSGGRAIYVRATRRFLANLYRVWGKAQLAARYAAQ